MQESTRVPDFEEVTKTKVRGVLAVMKHAEMFETEKGLLEAVKLRLSVDISNFSDLRSKHDKFLKRCVQFGSIFTYAP
jgi:hypothetical protein